MKHRRRKRRPAHRPRTKPGTTYELVLEGKPARTVRHGDLPGLAESREFEKFLRSKDPRLVTGRWGVGCREDGDCLRVRLWLVPAGKKHPPVGAKPNVRAVMRPGRVEARLTGEQFPDCETAIDSLMTLGGTLALWTGARALRKSAENGQ